MFASDLEAVLDGLGFWEMLKKEIGDRLEIIFEREEGSSVREGGNGIWVSSIRGETTEMLTSCFNSGEEKRPGALHKQKNTSRDTHGKQGQVNLVTLPVALLL